MVLSPIFKKFRAPAKLNIRLKVTGRRSDGYHELVSIMVPVSLFDFIELSLTSGNGINLTCAGLSIPDNEENLVCLAAREFISRTGFPDGLSIKLTKNIPVAAGLGGGSSDAACMLKALNSMCPDPVSAGELADIAVGLGADVPFFLKDMPCIARGIGEILEPIEKWPGFWYIVIMPPLKISTSWVYNNLKLKLTKNEYGFILKHLGQNPIDIVRILENDLEAVSCSYFPAINDTKNALLEAGAEGALMSGSGPSVFGVFKSRDQAFSAKRHLISQNLGDVFLVEG